MNMEFRTNITNSSLKILFILKKLHFTLENILKTSGLFKIQTRNDI
jgi:hypothetical protein